MSEEEIKVLPYKDVSFWGTSQPHRKNTIPIYCRRSSRDNWLCTKLPERLIHVVGSVYKEEDFEVLYIDEESYQGLAGDPTPDSFKTEIHNIRFCANDNSGNSRVMAVRDYFKWNNLPSTASVLLDANKYGQQVSSSIWVFWALMSLIFYWSFGLLCNTRTILTPGEIFMVIMCPFICVMMCICLYFSISQGKHFWCLIRNLFRKSSRPNNPCSFQTKDVEFHHQLCPYSDRASFR